MIFASKDELGCQRAGLRWWEILHGVRSRAPGMVSLVSKTYFDTWGIPNIVQHGVCQIVSFDKQIWKPGFKKREHVFCRVWGSEETVNDYKATIRIFSVRHQDSPGLQERFEQKLLQEQSKQHLWKDKQRNISIFISYLGPGVGQLYHSVWAGGSILFKVIGKKVDTSPCLKREEIVRRGLGFMVHDKQVCSPSFMWKFSPKQKYQVQPLCGPIEESEEQLFGYQVTLGKWR